MVSDILREAREAIQSMWDGRCNIYSYQETVDEFGATEVKPNVLLFKDLPCRLSFKNISQTSQGETFAGTSQVVKLFIAPELYVPPGCVFEVTQNGVTRKYKHSGVSAVYTNHQEIILDIYKERA
jgi:hypothetical protein